MNVSSWAHIFTAVEEQKNNNNVKRREKVFKNNFSSYLFTYVLSTIQKKAQKNKSWTTCKFFKGVLWDEMGKEDEKLYWKASNNQHEQNP